MFTRSNVCAAIVILLSTGSSQAQAPATAQREAIKKLDFLVGEWKGEGWMEFGPGQRRTFAGTEVVQRKLDGLLITIDGLHRSLTTGQGKDAVIHNAFTVVSYDEQAKKYRFQAFTARGNYENAEAKITEGQLVWGMKIPQFGEVCYTIKLDDKGRWFEIGEVTRDGATWQQFFEMKLERARPQ